ncbi:MAG: AraC family transcriptional regulator [Bacteroidota bacterium]
MKLQLESLDLRQSQQSIRAFNRVTEVFEPYWHFHPEVELTLIQAGEGLRFVGDYIEAYGPGDLILLGKNLPHQWVSTLHHKGAVQRAVVVQFPEQLFATFPECRLIIQLLSSAKRGIRFPFPAPVLIDKLTELPQLAGPAQLSALLSVLHELSLTDGNHYLSTTTHFSVAANQAAQQKRINVCTSYIVKNMGEQLSVKHMAERSQMQPQSFCRWFKQQTGQTFVHFLNNARIHSACVQLLSTDLPIQHIAYSVGFGHISHFNRTFKTSIGVAPSQFRKNKRSVA